MTRWMLFLVSIAVLMLARPSAAEERTSVYDVLPYGASSSADDNTTAVQAAIDACREAGGGIVQFPAGEFAFTGTLKIQGNGVWLRGVGRGATTLVFDNGGADCIVVGNRIPPEPPMSAWQTQFNRITDLYIAHGEKAAGRTIALINDADFLLENVTIDSCVVGVYAERINNSVLREVTIVPNNPGARHDETPWSTWTGIHWDTPPNEEDPSARSDCLHLDHVDVNFLGVPGTGLLWDGMSHTLTINYANILNGKYGFRVVNSRGNTRNRVPQFLNACNLLIEGSETAMSIEAGLEFKITTSDMDMCKGNTLQILPDPSGNPTGTVHMTNSRIGNCRKSAIVIDAADAMISNTQIFTASLAGRNKYPAITIGQHAKQVSLSNVTAEESSVGTGLASYGVSIAAGARNIMIENLNASHVNLAAVLDEGAANLVLGSVIEPEKASP